LLKTSRQEYHAPNREILLQNENSCFGDSKRLFRNRNVLFVQ